MASNRIGILPPPEPVSQPRMMAQLLQPSVENTRFLELLLEIHAEQKAQTKQLGKLQARDTPIPALPSTGEENPQMSAIGAPEDMEFLNQSRQASFEQKFRFAYSKQDWRFEEIEDEDDLQLHRLRPRAWYINHIITDDTFSTYGSIYNVGIDDMGTGKPLSRFKAFLSCYTETGWERFTITFDDSVSNEHVIAGLRMQNGQDNRVLLWVRLMSAIWDEVLKIRPYSSATNLRIGTEDGYQWDEFCAHVSEDIEGSIEYPVVKDFAHIDLEMMKETSLDITEHVAGWVYRVSGQQNTMVKKDIPMETQVASFKYEVDALSRLQHSLHVTSLFGLTTDSTGAYVKGMLVEDLRPFGVAIYEDKGNITWIQKLQWAIQILQGLMHVHAEGLVMGEVNYAQFGLRLNGDIVITGIKKRGCPIGWETPEHLNMKSPAKDFGGIFGPVPLRSGQKMDMYQAGLLLWMIAAETFPESRQPGWSPVFPERTPNSYREIAQRCLQNEPRDRLTASELLANFSLHQDLESLSAAKAGKPHHFEIFSRSSRL
jgi:hypothetical protein